MEGIFSSAPKRLFAGYGRQIYNTQGSQSSAMIRIYGIANCDTMRKARRWLDAHGVEYTFHDFKKQGLKNALLQQWLAAVGWETLLNRRGMMWRKLDPAVKENIDRTSAVAVMLETPSIIKRPVMDKDGEIHVGFTEQKYRQLFGI